MEVTEPAEARVVVKAGACVGDRMEVTACPTVVLVTAGALSLWKVVRDTMGETGVSPLGAAQLQVICGASLPVAKSRSSWLLAVVASRRAAIEAIISLCV